MRISPLYEAVVLALGIATSANAFAQAVIGKTAPESITEDLTISGAYDIGIYANSGEQLDFAGKNLSIDITEGSYWKHGNVGVWAYVTNSLSAKPSTINLGNKSLTENITVKVTDNSGVGDTAIGIWASGKTKDNIKGGVININTKSLVVDVKSKTWAYGIYSQNATTKATSDLSTVNINADDIYINASTSGAREDGYEANAIVVMSQGIMNINGNLEAHATTNVISARGKSVLKINEDGLHSTKLFGNIDFNYDKNSSGTVADATVIVNFSGSDSIWVGNSSVSYGTGKPSDQSYLDVSNLRIKLQNGAVWEPTVIDEIENNDTEGLENIPLNNLVLNDATINIKNSKQTVKVDNLEGTGGTINVAATAANGAITSIGKLSVGQTDADNDIKLAVNATGINADDISDVDSALTAMKDAVQISSNTVNSITNTVAEGAVKGAITQTVNADGTTSTVVQEENTKLSAFRTVSSMGVMAWRHDMNDLNKRMGELRDSPEGIGSWVRFYGSEQEYGRQNMTSKSTSVQVGSDVDVGYGWKVGGAFTYTDGSSTYANGSSDNKAYGFAAYGSWLADNGLFVDMIGKYSRLSSDFDLSTMGGKAKNNAYSASVEAGWHLPFAGLAFIEPQAELTYGLVAGDDFTTSNGIRVDQKDTEALIGRIGLRTGFHFPENKGTVYVRASVLHDWKGESEFMASLVSDSSVKSTLKDDIGGTYYEYGVGANFNWTKNAYSYVDLEKQNGGDVKENWRWNVGFRYVW